VAEQSTKTASDTSQDTARFRRGWHERERGDNGEGD
jgi:hypothetical protein